MDVLWHLNRKVDFLLIRAKILRAIRDFFDQAGYLEVETPILIPAPAPEIHIDPVPSRSWYLQTSPELNMKRLLAGGLHRIYQICHCFRDGERGQFHLPEFTMLEWYQEQGNYKHLMEECERLIIHIADRLCLGEELSFGGERINLIPPWDRLSLREAFQMFAPLTLEEAINSETFDEVLLEFIEPNITKSKPVFLYDYPLFTAPLAKAKENDPLCCERFELYIAGLELVNGMTELTDPLEQKKRFIICENKRRHLGKHPLPMPETFLRDLSAMPASAGAALGVDRLVMLFTGARTIEEVVAFPPELL
ncbi:MAG: EF-P lysine aminoacylase EpmA [Syntrophales bacterium]|nr:EF-P lysine aminoacylase EpmA [Syntrophales bacterium]